MGRVFLLSAEDDPADTIRPRLDAAGALVQAVELVEGVRRKDGETGSFNLAEDIAALDEMLTGNDMAVVPVRLLIVDPISAYLGDTDSHVNASVREALAPLAALAGKHKVAVVAVSHLNKSGGAAIYRATGSLAFMAAARAAWVVGRDPDNEERCLMVPVKQNLAPNEGGFAYRIEAVNTPSGIPAARVAWEEGRVQGDANQLLSNEEPGERAAWQEAADWLRERLAGSSFVPAKDVQREAAENGITKKSLWEASKRLGVVKGKSSYTGGWTWSLPASTAAKITELSQDYQDSPLGKVGILDPGGNLGNSGERDFTV